MGMTSLTLRVYQCGSRPINLTYISPCHLFLQKTEKENMDLRTSYQKLVTKVTNLENEKAEMQSELDQMRLLAKYKKIHFKKERDELQSEISELQMLVEDLRTQVGKFNFN